MTSTSSSTKIARGSVFDVPTFGTCVLDRILTKQYVFVDRKGQVVTVPKSSSAMIPVTGDARVQAKAYYAKYKQMKELKLGFLAVDRRVTHYACT